MRQLNEIEKSIIIDLAKSNNQPIFIHNYIVNVLDDCLLQINREKHKLDIVMFDDWENQNTERKDKIIEIAYDKTNKIITVINFLRYLEKNGYILTGYFAHAAAVDPTYGNEQYLQRFNEKGHKIVNWAFTDQYIKQLILDNIDLNIFPSEELRAFVNNNFKTKHDIRHTQTIKVAWTAIFISILIGLSGFFLNIFDFKENKIRSKGSEKGESNFQTEEVFKVDSTRNQKFLKNETIEFVNHDTLKNDK